MRFHLLLLPSILLVPIPVSCGSSSSSTGSGGSTGTGAGTTTDPCAGLGCAVFPGPLLLQVLDGMGQPVPSPTFSEKGAPVAAMCSSDGGVVDGGTCGTWEIDQLPLGANTITVSAPDYESTTVTVTIQGPSGCCGMGPAVSQSVTLQHATSDSGAE